MKLSRNTTYLLYAAFLMAPATALAQNCQEVKLASDKIKVSNVQVAQQNNALSVSMDLNLDSLYLPSNLQLVYTPVFKTRQGEIKMPEIVINGRRQQIMFERGVGKKQLNLSPEALVVRRTNKKVQTVNYSASIPLSGQVKNYDLNMHEDLCGCGNMEEGNDFNLRHRRQPQAVFVRPAVEAVKVRHLDKRAYIDFPVNRIELHADYRRNPAQLDSIVRTINALKDDKNLEVSAINIHGYASPESPYSHNDYLAKNRAKTLTDYVRRMVALPTQLFTVSSTAEDWDGLRNYLKDSNLEHKSDILAIANDEKMDPDTREQKIKKLYPSEYRFMLDTWYPALRHSDYHITYKVKPFDVAEAKEIIKTKPQQLSQEEMFLVAQTYELGSKEFNDVMEIAVRMFPENETANLNAANTRLNAGDADGAKSYLEKAGNSPEALNARGVYESLKGNDQQARHYFALAAKAGVKAAQENLENL